MRVLLTGIAGFIGHHFAEGILKLTDWELVGLDRVDQTASLERLGDTDAYRLNRHRCRLVWHDLKAPIGDYIAHALGNVDIVLHLAASTHVDRSITNPMEFVHDNVIGTAHLLEWARQQRNLHRFVYFSTDEVFGPAEPEHPGFKEWDRYCSSNPYSATKAGAEQLVYAYFNTYKLPAFTTNLMNCFGERQHPEKFLPLLVRSILMEKQIAIHADPERNVPTRRTYVHARNALNATLFLLDKAVPGERYNLGGEREVDSLEMAKHVAAILEKDLDYVMVDSVTNRPGHDSRYALDRSRLTEMGFAYPMTFEASLAKCVRWMRANPKWLLL